MASIEVSLVTPSRVLWEGEAQMVVMRTVDGEIAFLAGHVPLIGQVAPGLVKIQLPDGGEERFAVRGGFVEVKDNKASVLADQAQASDDVDTEAARKDLEAAESKLGSSNSGSGGSTGSGGLGSDEAGREASEAEIEAGWARARLELIDASS